MPEVKRISFGTPLPSQQEVYDALNAGYNRVWLLGAVGSGKSRCMSEIGIAESLFYPGNQGMFVRRTLKEVMDTTHQTFLETMAKANANDLIIKKQRDEAGGMNYYLRPFHWDGKEESLSLIQFVSATHGGKQDMEKFSSTNLGWVIVEELNQLEKQIWLWLTGRLRRENSRRIAVAAMNPPSPRHWVNEFCDMTRTGKGRIDGYYLIRSKTRDNVYLPMDYYESLVKQWPASWVHRYLEGNVGFLLEGKPVFEEDFKAGTHIDASLVPDDRTRIVRVWDIGFGRTPAVTWQQFVQTDKGLEWLVLDEYMNVDKQALSDFFATAMARQADLFGLQWESKDNYDPAGVAKSGQTGKSDVDILNEILRQYGIKPDFDSVTDNVRDSHVYRVGLMKNWLRLRPDGSPRFRLHPRCDMTIAGFLGGLQWAKDTPEGGKATRYLKNEYSHLMDTIFYGGVCNVDFNSIIGNEIDTEPDREWRRPIPSVNQLNRRVREDIRRGVYS